LGHILGLVDTTALNHDQRGGINECHCVNSCYMRQVMSIEELIGLLIEIGPNPIFCPDCLAVIV